MSDDLAKELVVVSLLQVTISLLHHLSVLGVTGHCCCIHYFMEDIFSVLNGPQMNSWSLTPSTLPCLWLPVAVMDTRVSYKTGIRGWPHSRVFNVRYRKDNGLLSCDVSWRIWGWVSVLRHEAHGPFCHYRFMWTLQWYHSVLCSTWMLLKKSNHIVCIGYYHF